MITSFIICWFNDYPHILNTNDASIAIAMGGSGGMILMLAIAFNARSKPAPIT